MSSITFDPAQVRNTLGHFEGVCWRLIGQSTGLRRNTDGDTRLSRPFESRDTTFATRFSPAGRHVPGVLYGSERITTAAAEVIFHRLLFYAQSEGLPLPGRLSFEAFCVTCQSEFTVDLLAPPFSDAADAWVRPADYGPTNAVAAVVLEAGGHLIRFRSVRDPRGGVNFAVLDRKAISSVEPEVTVTVIVTFKETESGWVAEIEALGDTATFPLAFFFSQDVRLAPLAFRLGAIVSR